MGDEFTDVSSVEELSLCFQWVQDGNPEDDFLEVLHINSCNAEAITSSITTYSNEKKLETEQMRGMGFDGAATLSGRKGGVQALLRKIAPHAVFIDPSSQPNFGCKERYTAT